MIQNITNDSLKLIKAPNLRHAALGLMAVSSMLLNIGCATNSGTLDPFKSTAVLSSGDKNSFSSLEITPSTSKDEANFKVSPSTDLSSVSTAVRGSATIFGFSLKGSSTVRGSTPLDKFTRQR